ncbi:hypothetical protein JCM5296_005095 [Sporobolomyces johnsonii]
MLFLDLPLELLHLIISLVGGPYNPKDYATRLKDLRNCCLVSRSFRQIAQPELFAVLEVEGIKRLEAFRAAAKATGLGRTTGTVAFRGDTFGGGWGEESGLTAERVRAALEDLSSLREVRISWIEGIDMAWLGGLPELRYLLLFHVTVTTSSPSFSLPRLVQLSACCVDTKPPLCPACFSVETMPSLQLAAIVADQDHRDWPRYLMEQLSPDLASKLEFMVIEFIDWSDAHSVSPSCGPRTLLDCYFTQCRRPFDRSLPPISHLRFRPDGTASYEDIVIAFTILANMLTTSHPAVSTLRSIHLHPGYEFRPGIAPEVHPGMFAAYQGFLSVMAQKGVEILIDAQPQYDIDSYIPRRALEWVRPKGARD